jgi:hypothetical protein
MRHELIGSSKSGGGRALSLFLLVGLVMALAGSLPVLAAGSLFSDGFESGDFGAWTSSIVESGNLLEVTAAAAQEGSYGLHVVSGGTNDDATVTAEITPTNVIYSRALVKLISDVGEGSHQIFLAAATASQSGFVGALALRNQPGSGLTELHSWAGSYESSGFEFTTGIWYCVETAVIADSSAGSVQAWVNGVPVVDRQNLNTGSSPIDWVRIGVDGANVTSEYAFDSVEVDDTGSVGCATGTSAPSAFDDGAATDVDTAIVIDVLGNDSDPNEDPLSLASVTTPANGTTSANPDGTVTYTPATGFTGVDPFTYTNTDGNETSNVATVTVFVNAVPQLNTYQAHVSTSTGDPSTEATITWKTPTSAPSYVRIGTSKGAYGPAEEGIWLAYPNTNTGGDVCCIQAWAFTSLSPSTAYYYQVGSDAEGWSLEYSGPIPKNWSG